MQGETPRQVAYRVIRDTMEECDDLLITYPEEDREAIADAVDGLLDELRQLVPRELQETRDVLYLLYMLVTTQASCDFRNGVTDEMGTVDQGEQQAGEILESARQLLVEQGCLRVMV